MSATVTQQAASASSPEGEPPASPIAEEPASSWEGESPLERLTAEQLERLGAELDAIHDRVFAELGERDARYIRRTIRLHRQLVLGARIALLGSRRRPLWLAGTAALSLAKVLENM